MPFLAEEVAYSVYHQLRTTEIPFPLQRLEPLRQRVSPRKELPEEKEAENKKIFHFISTGCNNLAHKLQAVADFLLI